MADKSSRQYLTGHEVLFGLDPETGIVAAEPDPRGGVRVFSRSSEGVSSRFEAFRPWMILPSTPHPQLGACNCILLEGHGLSHLAEFATWKTYQAAGFRVRDLHLERLGWNGTKCYLLRSGKTLFKGMRFEDIVRLQFDIETSGLDPAQPGNRIIMIAISTSHGLVELIEGDEQVILETFIARLTEIDPDVVEGHNVFGFDLPFIITRARHAGVELSLGRDGSVPVIGRTRNYAIGGASRPFAPVSIYGRHVLDTYLIVQRFDWAHGSLSSYGLKECARQFGFAHENRVELPGAEIHLIYARDPDLVREYARQDVIETRLLADLVTPIEFYQTQMVPDAYGQTAVTGTGERINSLMMRAYLAAGAAIPRPEPSQPFPGGYTEIRETGVLHRVVKADVESLYPSIMLSGSISPQRDHLGVFLPALRDLTTRRIEAKRLANAETDPAISRYWDGVQGSFKVLINSFYGYLAGPFPWNDYSAAKRVTEVGRDLVVTIARTIEGEGGRVIEIDTDGLYFVPPDGVVGEGEQAERAYVAHVGTVLPAGIRLAFDGRFQKMLSVKTKNYVLEKYDGKRIFKGSSLRSRADEAFGRRFLAEAVDRLLSDDRAGVGDLYRSIASQIECGEMPVEDLLRRERVTEKTFTSGQKRRSARIAEGIAIGDHIVVLELANGDLGEREDYTGPSSINRMHYLEKLYRFACRLQDAFRGEFDRFIPKPANMLSAAQGQTSLDLFD